MLCIGAKARVGNDSQAGAKAVKKIWTFYPLLSEHLALDGFELSGDRAGADVIISNSPVRDFLSLPRSALPMVARGGCRHVDCRIT